MIQYERDNVAEMQRGQGQNGPLVNPQTWQHVQESHVHLSPSQRAAVEQIVSGRDKIMGLEGVAGAGKTTSLSAIREAAECEGYQVIGLAPTSRAAHKLAESGIESGTLQRHLIRHEAPTDGKKRLFVIDESSLASTKQMNEFFHGLHTSDRVLLVGDTRQHEAVEAGRPYKQLQEAGMQTAKLDQILRQKDPMLKETVEQLARGDVRGGVANLEQQGRVPQNGFAVRELALLAYLTCDVASSSGCRPEIGARSDAALPRLNHNGYLRSDCSYRATPSTRTVGRICQRCNAGCKVQFTVHYGPIKQVFQ